MDKYPTLYIHRCDKEFINIGASIIGGWGGGGCPGGQPGVGVSPDKLTT